MRSRKASQATLVSVVCLLCILLPGAVQPSPQNFDLVQRELLLLLQGSSQAVRPSPAICAEDDVGLEQHKTNLREWYLGSGNCRINFEPRFSILATSIASRETKALFSTDASRVHLNRLLEELQQLAVSGGLTLEQKLELQSTAWEITFGLKRFMEGDSEAKNNLDMPLKSSLRLLTLTLFNSQELAKIPATLSDLPRLAKVTELNPIVDALLRHTDSCVLEVRPPTDLHATALFGRFTPRIFLTLEKRDQCGAFAAYISDPSTSYEALGVLPSKFAGLKAIVILFFNVLTEDYTIETTPLVAIWHEYTFSSLLERRMSYEEFTENIRFRTIEYEGILERGESLSPAKIQSPISYRVVDEKRMALPLFLDIKPAVPGLLVTSHQGSCLRCHLNRVATFSTHGPRALSIGAPVPHHSRALLTPFYTEIIEPRLRQWARVYLEGSNDKIQAVP